MKSTGSDYLQTRLRFLWTTMPSASRCHTARGRLNTCRQLTELSDDGQLARRVFEERKARGQAKGLREIRALLGVLNAALERQDKEIAR